VYKDHVLYHSEKYGFTFYHFYNNENDEMHIHLDLPHFSKDVYKEIKAGQKWYENFLKEEYAMNAIYTAVQPKHEHEVRWVERLGFEKIEEHVIDGQEVYKYRKEI